VEGRPQRGQVHHWRDEGRAAFFLNELAGAIVQAENWQA
jgi:hypothetical protein